MFTIIRNHESRIFAVTRILVGAAPGSCAWALDNFPSRSTEIMRRVMVRTPLLVAVAAASLGLLAGACGSESSTAPSGAATVTLAVGSETFRVALTTPQQVDAARAAQAGGPARIPSGRIVAGAQVNTGWTWHLEDVAFVEATIELCDGRPSDVEREGTAFGGGRFCPWSATVLRIE